MNTPKRLTFWIIVMGAQPTAFRARHAEDLLPTLKQLQRTQPSAEMKWFERGRFWDSPDAAEAAYRARRREAGGRDSGWRPGGDHKDPRAQYELTRDQKRARFKQRLIHERSNDRPSSDRPGAPPSGKPAKARDDRSGRPSGAQQRTRSPGGGGSGKASGPATDRWKPSGIPGRRKPGTGGTAGRSWPPTADRSRDRSEGQQGSPPKPARNRQNGSNNRTTAASGPGKSTATRRPFTPRSSRPAHDRGPNRRKAPKGAK